MGECQSSHAMASLILQVVCVKCILFIVTFLCISNAVLLILQYHCRLLFIILLFFCGLYYCGLFLFRRASVFNAPHLMTWFSQQESGKIMTAGGKLDLMYHHVNFQQAVHSSGAISLHFVTVIFFLWDHKCLHTWSGHYASSHHCKCADICGP